MTIWYYKNIYCMEFLYDFGIEIRCQQTFSLFFLFLYGAIKYILYK